MTVQRDCGLRIADCGFSKTRNPKSAIRNPKYHYRGQVMIEFAISLTGLVMFIYVFLKMWGWLSGMIVHRQSYFQATRVDAGKVATAGKEVGYAREPLKLVGIAGSVGGDGIGFPSIPVPVPPCAAAKPFYDQAKAHFDQAAAYRAQAKPYLDDMQTLSTEAQAIQTRLDQIDARLAVINPRIAELDAACAGGGGNNGGGDVYGI